MNSDPSNRNVPIPEDQVTWQMRAHAIGSPDNIHHGAYKPEVTTEHSVDSSAEAVGNTATGSLIEVDDSSVEPTKGNEYDDLWSNEPFDEKAAIEAAAIRPKPREANIVAIKTRQQMDISAADRKNRAAAGLPPRIFDLK